MALFGSDDKTSAVALLQSMGLAIPGSFFFAKDSADQLEDFLVAHHHISYWYLRVDRPLQSLLPKNVWRSRELERRLRLLLRNCPEVHCVIQPRINVACSGVLATIRDGTVIEYVRGGLRSLLRDGATPSCLVADLSGRILTHQCNIQEFWYEWEGEELITHPEIRPSALTESCLDALLYAASKVQGSAAFEWVQDFQNRVFFLDFKRLNDGFLQDKTAFLRGLQTGYLVALTEPLEGLLVCPWPDERQGIFVMPSPLYDYLPAVLDRAKGVVCGAGGVLSHLIIYATGAQIPVICLRRATPIPTLNV